MQQNNYLVSRCAVTDCADIVALGKLVWSNYASGITLSRQLIDLDHPIFIARDASGQLAGYAIGVVHASQSSGHIFSIVIHPDYRSVGLGRKLATALIDAFRERNLESITAMIADDNVASQNLFSSFGFQKREDIQNYYEEGDSYGRYEMGFR